MNSLTEWLKVWNVCGQIDCHSYLARMNKKIRSARPPAASLMGHWAASLVN
jgi:hypothetical protein